MNSTWKTIVGVVLAILVVWGIYALSQGGAQLDEGTQQAEMADGPIKVGFVGPLSGDAAAYGEPALNVTQLAVDEINADGGINGRMIDLVVEDGQCDGATAASAAQKLVNVDHVQFMTGGICSSEALAMMPILEQAHVFFLAQATTSPDLTDISPYYARVISSDVTQGAVLADAAYNKMGWRKVAIAQESLDYSLGLTKAFKDVFDSYGGEVIVESFPSKETDFRSLLTKLQAEEPDALFINTQAPAGTERILQQLGDIGWEIPLMIDDATSTDADTVRNNAELLEGTLAAQFGVDDSNTAFAHLKQAYQERYGAELPFQAYGQFEYDAVLMLADGLRANGTDSMAVANWVREVKDWKGSSGIVDIAENGDRVGGHLLHVIKDGKTVLYSQN